MREISGDSPLSWNQKIAYLGINIWKNLLGIRFPGKTVFWHSFFDTDTSDSPARGYLDLFMEEMVPTLLSVGKISVCDIGCGTAYMRKVLARAGYSGEYVGVDVVREPNLDESAVPSFSMMFVKSDINVYEPSRTFDLVLSNTSLEHIPDDFAAVRRAHELCADNGVEVHIVPSHWALPLYLWHGYRQYTPAQLQKMFSGTSHTIYRLGGFASWLLHLFFITLPERILGMKSLRGGALYPHMKRFAVHIDCFLPFFPSLYAVVFYGNKK